MTCRDCGHSGNVRGFLNSGEDQCNKCHVIAEKKRIKDLDLFDAEQHRKDWKKWYGNRASDRHTKSQLIEADFYEVMHKKK